MMTSIEDWLTYFAYVLPLVVVALVATRRRAARHAENAAIHYESVEAGLTAPPSLHPVIDHRAASAAKRACTPVRSIPGTRYSE